MKLQTAKIVSAPSKSCWSQVYLEDNLLVVIKIEKETDPSSRAREIIARFQEDYTSFEGRLLKKLEVSLGKIQEENLEMVVGVVFNNALYLGILNRGKVVLLREKSLVTILEAKEGVTTASGFFKENDLFVLGTERFFQLVSQDILKTNLENKDLDEAIEALTPIVHAKKEDGGVAVVIGKLKRGDSFGMKNEKLKIKEKLGQFFQRIVGQKRAIYLPRRQKPETKQQRMMLTVGVILAILLLVSIVFGFFKKRREREVERFNQFWQEIEYKYEQGKELVELNPIRSRELLQESLNLVGERKDDYPPKSWQYKKLEAIGQETETALEKVLREYELAEVPVFLDLPLVKQGLRGIDFDFWEKEMVVLGEDGTVITIDLNKKTEILGKVEGGKLVTLWGEKAFVLGEIEKDWSPTLQSFSDEATEVVGFEAFAGNLYLLDKEGIFKYPSIEEGFGAKRSWLGLGVEPDLTEAVEIAIDGDVWVLLANGEILKFSRGAPKAFGVSGLDKGLKGPTAFYTDKACQKIYVLDKGNKRIVVLLKSGEYDSQYLWKGIKEVDDLVVSEKEKKIFLLSGGKIYAIEVK